MRELVTGAVDGRCREDLTMGSLLLLTPKAGGLTWSSTVKSIGYLNTGASERLARGIVSSIEAGNQTDSWTMTETKSYSAEK